MPAVIGIIPSSSGHVPLDTHQQIVAGDDYKAADGRSLSWSSGAWPDLSGASLTLLIGHSDPNVYGNLPTTITGTVPATPANPMTISLDIAGTATANLPGGQMQYMLTATLLNGDKVTIADGNITIIAAP